MFKSNFFLIISNRFGKTLFTISSGNVGLKNIKKREFESVKILLLQGFKYLLKSNKTNNIFFKIEGSNSYFLSKIIKYFLSLKMKYSVNLIGVELINKKSHNGCKKKNKKNN